MKSTDIKELSVWDSWPRPALSKAPETPGVYIFRLSECFGRMQGESDIVYIGSAKNMKRRLTGHRLAAIGSLARVPRYGGTLQVAWKSCREESEAISEESRLLRKYARQHIDHPPLNRQQPLKVWQQYLEALSQLLNVEVDDQLEERGRAAFQQLEEQVASRRKPEP